MTVTLTWLVNELATLVPAVDGTPTAAQYERAVRDAVADLGFRLPRIGQATLAVTAGTAVYDLPAGFTRLIGMERIDGVRRNGAGYLVPASASAARSGERYTISGGQITFHPVPAYTLDRIIRYAAGYPYDTGTDVFIGLTDDLARIAMLRAQATGMRAQATTAAAGAGLSYTIGDTTVTRAVGSGNAVMAAAGELAAAYQDAIRQARGFIGARGEWQPS